MSDFPHWPTRPTGKLFHVKGRIGWRNLRRSDFCEDGPYLITGMHIDDAGRVDWNACFHIPRQKFDESPEIQVQVGDLAITKDGTIGKVARIDWLPGDTSLNSHLFLVRPVRADRCSTRFAFHVFNSQAFRRYIESHKSGSTLEGLGEAKFVKFEFPLPTVAEQAAVSNVLDTIDTAIQGTEAIITKLKAVKRGLLHDLLTRGIDANGELRRPQLEAPHLFKLSPLGWIPKEWEASDASTEFNVDAGITLGGHRVPRFRPRRYLRVANVHRGRLVLDDIAELEASDSEAKARELSPGDLLVVEGHASTHEIGRCAMADESVRGMLFQNHLFRLRSKNLLTEFALLWLNSDFVQAYWRMEAATSSGLNTINRAKLCRMPVAVPERKEQTMIAAREAAIASRIDDESRVLAKLKAEKAGLMNDLLTGRVRVTSLLEPATA